MQTVLVTVNYAQDYRVYVSPTISQNRDEHSDLCPSPFPSSGEENRQRLGP